MAWDDNQTSTDRITYVEWNDMVDYMKSAISANDTIDVTSFNLDGVEVTSSAAELNILDGVTISSTEIDYLSGVTSNIQTQLDSKTDNTDTDVSGNSWVLDEDDLVSDSNTKVPTQQSTKAYVDNGLSTKTDNTDTDVSDNNWVLDEDDFTSNSDAKLATQQSIKAYVDSNAGGISAVEDDTSPSLGGDLDLNTNSILVSQTQTSSGDYEATNKFSGTAGESLSQFDVVVLQSDGQYDKALADTQANVKGRCAIVLDSSISSGSTGNFSEDCIIKNTGWSFTVGAELFIDPSTAGDITETVPSTSGDQIRKIGEALSSDTIRFNPSNDYYEVA